MMTKNLIQSFFSDGFLRYVLSLCDYPLLQLDLLECILEDRKLGIKVDDDLLLIYIRLLCKLNYSDEVGNNLLLKLIFKLSILNFE
jgi:hypothetical protein